MTGPCVSCHRFGRLNEDYRCAVCVAQPVCTTVPASDLAADVAPANGGRACSYCGDGPCPHPDTKSALGDTCTGPHALKTILAQGRTLWRKYEGSQRHPCDEDTRWASERQMWLWFQKHGKLLLEALEKTCR